MYLPRFITFLISIAFLAPIAWIFLIVIRDSAPNEEDLRAYEDELDAPPAVSGYEQGDGTDGEEMSITGSSSEVTLMVAPFMFANRWIQYSARRSVGYIGMAALAILFGCIVSLSFFPKVIGTSDIWTEEDGDSGYNDQGDQ